MVAAPRMDSFSLGVFVMAEPTLVALFGANAVQDADTLTLSKTDLAAVGLTPSANNSAEALLTAIVKKAGMVLTPNNQDLNPDQSITIEDGFPSIIQRNDTNYRQNQKTISFQKLDTQAEIDPDDY
jgi:hypothetical protein